MSKNSTSERKSRTPGPSALADSLMNTVFASASISRAPPVMPTLEKVVFEASKDSRDQVNGGNFFLTFSAAAPATDETAEIPEIMISREILLDEQGNYSMPGIVVNQLVNLPPVNRDTQGREAVADVVSVRVGRYGEDGSTYLLDNVPATKNITDAFQRIVDGLNSDPKVVEGMKKRGWLIDASGVLSIQIPTSKIEGFGLYYFASVGSDGKLNLDLNENHWSLKRGQGLAQITAVDSDGSARNLRGRSFRGRSRNSRKAQDVLAHLQKQVEASEAYAESQKIEAKPFSERNAARTSSTPSRFSRQAPGTIQSNADQFSRQSSQRVRSATEVDF